MNVLLFGATGMVGGGVLGRLLTLPELPAVTFCPPQMKISTPRVHAAESISPNAQCLQWQALTNP